MNKKMVIKTGIKNECSSKNQLSIKNQLETDTEIDRVVIAYAVGATISNRNYENHRLSSKVKILTGDLTPYQKRKTNLIINTIKQVEGCSIDHLTNRRRLSYLEALNKISEFKGIEVGVKLSAKAIKILGITDKIVAIDSVRSTVAVRKNK